MKETLTATTLIRQFCAKLLGPIFFYSIDKKRPKPAEVRFGGKEIFFFQHPRKKTLHLIGGVLW